MEILPQSCRLESRDKFGVLVLITAAFGLMAMRSMDTVSSFTI
jgi:hypothetical protein